MRRGSMRFLLLLLAGIPRLAVAEDVLAAQGRREYQGLKIQRERLIDELRQAWKELDEAPRPGPDVASRLQEAAAREQAAREKEAILLALLSRARELRQAQAAAAVAGPSSSGSTSAGPYEGAWRLTLDGAEGRLSLTQVGALLTGTYSIKGKGRGTVSGHGSRSRLTVTLLDEKGDLFAVLDGDLTGRDVLGGTYLRRELAAGEPAQGSWSAARTE